MSRTTGWWTLEGDDEGLRLSPAKVRDLGSEQFTWAHLLYGRLASARVVVIYFASRTDAPEDATTKEVLRAFGDNTGSATSVNFWDMRDAELTQALELFGLRTPPALVLASGLKGVDDPGGPADAPLYTIAITGRETLRSADAVSEAVNAAHEVLMRADQREIAAYLRRQDAKSVLDAIASVGARVRDQLLKLKPSFGLPGGFSISLGG